MGSRCWDCGEKVGRCYECGEDCDVPEHQHRCPVRNPSKGAAHIGSGGGSDV